MPAGQGGAETEPTVFREVEEREEDSPFLRCLRLGDTEGTILSQAPIARGTDSPSREPF